MVRSGQSAANGACVERKSPGAMRRNRLSAPPDGGGKRPGDSTRAPAAIDFYHTPTMHSRRMVAQA